jgi:hypothetical protein
MVTRRRSVPRPPPEDWTITTELTIHGRRVEPGTELTIRGVRGRVRFVRHILRDNGTEWIDVVAPDSAGWRSFRPDRVRTVHTRRRLRASA